MFLKQFYTNHSNNILIKAEQASLFAKEIAGDFNPLHDPDAKRFCVPGDLLFSLVLDKYGLSQKMSFTFSGMVGHGVYLDFPETDDKKFSITDEKGKTYLHVERKGETVTDKVLIETFIRNYVAFSGPNFPHVLVPLMAQHDVMINTKRPLVIYDSMSFELDHLNFTSPDLEAAETTLEISGKRGEARLYFKIKADGENIGCGFKKLVISNMREYNYDVIHQFTEDYLARMSAYKASQPK
jgi:uncharacterized protein DUF3581